MAGAAKRPVLVFDMDGVLVEVTESYRETIVRTVEHFTGRRIARDLIQDYKNQGGWNNDWALAQKIAADLGVEVDYETVVEKFQEIFLGPARDGSGGLIERERWIPADGLLERLGERFQLAIFTGRIREELEITLRRFAPRIRFDPTLCTREVPRSKPAPDGLRMIAERTGGARLYYVGDTVDDSRCARAASVPFIGIAAPGNPRHDELVSLFEQDGAIAVLPDVNRLEDVLP